MTRREELIHRQIAMLAATAHASEDDRVQEWCFLKICDYTRLLNDGYGVELGASTASF